MKIVNYYKDFIEANYPIGTKVRYKDKEWLFVGLGFYASGNEPVIQLSKSRSKELNPEYDYISSWEDKEIEIIGIPKIYTTPPLFHVGDIVYYRKDKFIILEERYDNYMYKVYDTNLHDTDEYDEEDLTLEPTVVEEESEDK